MKTCDLHTHSIYSDGTCTPKEIIDLAMEIGLAAVALCDHNTVDGLPVFLESAKGSPIEAIAGAEFSVDYHGRELHLLALFIPECQFDKVSDLMAEVNERKRKSNQELIAALNRAGYRIDYAQLCASTPNGKFNRAHVAAELTRMGEVASIKTAFDTLLSPKAGYYKEPKRLDFFEMIEFVTSIGAVPVLAHPFLNLQKDELETLLPIAKEAGLAGMECYYSEYDENTTKTALQLARRFGLKPSGGSDFHGDNKPGIRLGIGHGNLKIPYEWAETFKNEA
ncbi:MAG: PHP domain-containing protein [Oscillospiraceae bacterium]|nr:PHP domain-containing protein [Oscillospiraceae bacterium]